jgi:hypothetical protein
VRGATGRRRAGLRAGGGRGYGPTAHGEGQAALGEDATREVGGWGRPGLGWFFSSASPLIGPKPVVDS